MQVRRDNKGKFKRKEITDAIRKALMEDSGEPLRRKAKELILRITDKEERRKERKISTMLWRS